MQISPNFTLAQLTCSETAEARGIDNSPPPEVVENLKQLAEGLEQVQALLGHPLQVSNGYRCPDLNAIVGGSPASQHVQGLAADFVCPGSGEPLEVARLISESEIAFDQCILEYGRWIHISFSPEPRGRVLTIYDNTEGYVAGLWDRDGNRVA